MTLVLTMLKPEGIYLAVDYRITYGHPRYQPTDADIKSLMIDYAGGQTALIGYTGAARSPDGTPTGTWLRETVRGQFDVIDVSMAHLRERLNRDYAPMKRGLIVSVAVIEGERRLYGAFSNLIRTDTGEIDTVGAFEYVMLDQGDAAIIANGSGGWTAAQYDLLAPVRPQLRVWPNRPQDHMKLLAGVNRAVAAKDTSVSPFCHVSFVPSTLMRRNMSATSITYTEHGESAPFSMPVITKGLDVTGLAGRVAAWGPGGVGVEPPTLSQAEWAAEMDRRP